MAENQLKDERISPRCVFNNLYYYHLVNFNYITTLFRMLEEDLANKESFLKRCKVHAALKKQISKKSPEVG